MANASLCSSVAFRTLAVGVGGARWGRVLCGGALGVLVFCGAAEGNTSTSRKTQEPVASSSDEDVLCINIKIVLHLRTNVDGR